MSNSYLRGYLTIQFKNLTMFFGAQTISENVNLSIPDNVKIGIIAHRTPQLAFEVITKNINWEEANRCDWRKTGD